MTAHCSCSALEDDATTAIAKLQGKEVRGRPLKLELGLKKDRKLTKNAAGNDLKEVKPVPAVETKASRKAVKPAAKEEVEEAVKEEEDAAQPAAVDAPAAAEGDEKGTPEEVHIKRARQILVFGVPVDVSKKVFKMALTKVSRKVEVELVKQDHALSEAIQIAHPPGKVVLLTAASKAEATKVLAALAATNINNLGFAKHMLANEEAVDPALEKLTAKALSKEKLVARTLAEVTEAVLRKRRCRVIVRNLSFQATEQNVLDKLARFGPIVDVDVPRMLVTKADGKQTERIRGFAFATFLCLKDAQQAVAKAADLKICNRPVAIDFSLSKEAFVKYGDTGGSVEGTNEIDMGEGAVDAEGQHDPAEAGETAEEEEGDDEDSGADSDMMDDDEEDPEEDDDNDGSDTDEADESEDEDDEPQSSQPKKQRYGDDVHEGRTVFVRGLPFDAVAADLRQAFGTFGRVELAVVVMDKASGMSKGMAFVKFVQASSASTCVAAATPDGVLVKQRLCKVDIAVDKASVDQIKSKELKAKDKRNIYLANEGLVASETTPMSAYDREKRERAQSEKKKKLLNPLFFVSDKRLNLRNLSKAMGDQEVRALCIEAAKAGLKNKLVSTKDMHNALVAQGNASTAVVASFKPKSATNASSSAADPLSIPPVTKGALKTAKVMRDMDRLTEGKAQSRGYAFVEFRHHAHALACLRELNNNTAYADRAIDADGKGMDPVKSRIMVEFSLENMRKVKILQERQEKSRLAGTKEAKDAKEVEKSMKAGKDSSTKDSSSSIQHKKRKAETKVEQRRTKQRK